MKRQDIKAILNTIRKKLGPERGYQELGFTFYFDAMTACEMLTKLLEKGACFTWNSSLAEWFDIHGFKVRELKDAYNRRYVIS